MTKRILFMLLVLGGWIPLASNAAKSPRKFRFNWAGVESFQVMQTIRLKHPVVRLLTFNVERAEKNYRLHKTHAKILQLGENNFDLPRLGEGEVHPMLKTSSTGAFIDSEDGQECPSYGRITIHARIRIRTSRSFNAPRAVGPSGR